MRRFALLALLLIPAAAHADERTFMLSGFDHVRVDGPFEVVVVTGRSAAARAQGDARALDLVEVAVEGTTLRVSASLNAWGGDPNIRKLPPRVFVTVPRLEGAIVVGGGRLTVDRLRGQHVDLGVTGSGSLTVAEADADELDAALFGVGALTVGGRARIARFQVNGVGAIDAGALVAGDLSVTSEGDGDSRFRATRTAGIIASGQGRISVAGPATCTVSGTAPVECGAAAPPAP